ncbi:MAG: Hsp70 family protein [Pirellulaceae bacterium]
MKQIVVGIDLGTTNSVIAVPGQYPDHGIVFGNVTVLWDESERLTHASAVCKVGDELTVGDDAKVLASEGFTPVRFVKKYMGTETLFCVGDDEERPEEVSAHVLRHLCAIAEQQLGVKVTGAVITHPAYFDGVAINATKQAGSIAGLRVAGLLMEPVAAAMAYCVEDERSQLRALIYDLGGGTFDVTLIERSGNTFLPVAFGGNRELGGYNFDKKIAMAMLTGLREKGYSIEIDPTHPERDPRWATLMYHAERVKMQLSAKDGQAKATVRVPGAFKDNSSPAKSVQLSFAMTRKEFLDLIEPEIVQTMRETKKVMESANLTAEDIDYLVLVGGSSRIYAIQQRLRDEFGLDPQFDDDVFDLSVAVGAAMVAAAAGTTEDGVTLDAVPEETHEATLPFSGTVERTGERTEVANLTVTVSGGATGDESTLTSAEGKFYVPAELELESENELRLTIQDPSGKTFFGRTFCVVHSAESEVGLGPEPPKAMLPKPISVETASGFSELAAEGVMLPYRHQKSFQTTEELEIIPIDLYQEDIQLTTIELKGFSKPVPANCRVELEIEIGADYEMKATAIVPAASIQKTLQVKLAPLAVPDVETLQREFKQRKAEYQSQLENTPDGAEKAKIGVEGDLVIEEIEELLKAELPEQLQVFMLIKKLYVLTKQLALTGGLTPSKAAMDARFQKVRDKLQQAIAKQPSIQEQNYDSILDTLEEESQRAYQANDATAWSQLARKLDDIIDTLDNAMRSSGGGGPDLPPGPILRAFFMQAITETRQEVSAKTASGSLTTDNASRCNQHLDAAEQEISQVDMSDDDTAKRRLVTIYQQHIMAAQQIAGVSTEKAKGKIEELSG